MSRIESVKQNYQTNCRPNYAQARKSQNQPLSFIGKEKISDEIFQKVSKDVESKIDGNLGKVGKYLKRFSDKDGEAQNQLINAFFTTTLAPVMIAWNPFTNQDEKTKKYSALRQPISAGIAITGGLAMTKGVNYYMSKLASEGYIDKIDLRLKPEENEYLKSKFKKENNIKFFMNKAEKEKFKDYVKKVHSEREKLYTQLFIQKPDNIEIDEKTSEIFLKDTKTPLGKNIPNLKTKAQLKKHLEKNNAHNITVRDIAKEKFGLEFFPDGKLKQFIAEEKLTTIMASDFFHELGLIKKGSISKDDFSKGLSEIRQEEKTINEVFKALKVPDDSVEKLKKILKISDEEAQGIVNLFSVSEEKAKEVVKAVSKEAHRDLQMNMGDLESKRDSSSLGQVLNRLGYKNRELIEGETKEAGYCELQELMNMKLTDAWDTLANKFKGKIKGFDVEPEEFKKLPEKFTKLFIENKSTLNASNFKNYGKHVNILLNLPMTAITCYVLNWSYPRIVESLFPNLVKNDTQKGGNK